MTTRRDEVRLKHQRICQYLDDHELHVVVLLLRSNFAWYTAGGLNRASTADSIGAAGLLNTREKAVCITTSIEPAGIAGEELADLDIEILAAPWHDAAALTKLCRSAIGRLRATCDRPSAGQPDQVTSLGADFSSLRWVMTDRRPERYRILARQVAERLETACCQLRPGMTGGALASKIAEAACQRAIRRPVLLMAADKRVKLHRHHIPTGRKFGRYGMAVPGAERDGLPVSFSRVFSLGPIGADLRRHHEALCRIDAAMMAATHPGRRMSDVLALEQQTYSGQGFADEWTRHHQGGLTGYLGREIRLSPDSYIPIPAGQVFGWNCSIAGTKTEDTILVGPEDNKISSVSGQWTTTHHPSMSRAWLRRDIRRL